MQSYSIQENYSVSLSNLKVIAEKRHLQLSELANKMGISETGLRRISRENSTSLRNAVKLCRILRVPIEFFILDMKTAGSLNYETGANDRIIELEKEVTELNKLIVNLTKKIV